MLLIISIILIIVSILILIYALSLSKKTHIYNQEIDKQNQQLEKINQKNKKEYENILSSIELQKQRLDDAEHAALIAVNGQKELSQKAYENYCEVLDKQYEKAEDEYTTHKEAMETAYSNLQLELIQKMDAAKKELAQIEATRAAAIQAQLKEKEIKDNKDNFRLNISEASKKDIRLLKSIQPDITNSIVIDKIIWSNYYQPLAKTKFPQIIGKATACGIYKITSLTTGAPYIGQSSDCCDRWKQHCKNALGVGNVVNKNKLYKAMKEEGLYNFTFEMLEECDRSVLDEKEKYYIKLYKAYDFGLNGNRGNN